MWATQYLYGGAGPVHVALIPVAATCSESVFKTEWSWYVGVKTAHPPASLFILSLGTLSMSLEQTAVWQLPTNNE